MAGKKDSKIMKLEAPKSGKKADNYRKMGRK